MTLRKSRKRKRKTTPGSSKPQSPALLEGERDPHVVVNHRQVRAVLEKSGKVSLVLQGHCHSGALTVQRGISYVTLKALVEGERQIPGLRVDCDPQKEEYRLEFFDGAETDDGETE